MSLKAISHWVLLLLCSNVKAQSYSIRSIDNEPTIRQITVAYNEVENRLLFKSGSKQKAVEEVTNVKEQFVTRDSSFLVVTYAVRVGSGIKLRRTLYLAVKGGRLIESLHFTSSYNAHQDKAYNNQIDSLGLFYEKEVYTAALITHHPTTSSYVPQFDVRHVRVSKQQAIDNYEYQKNVKLFFDREKAIFYSSEKKLNGTYLMYDSKTKNDKQRVLKGRYPAVALGNKLYFYIDNKWYENEEGYLISFSIDVQ